MLSRLLEKLQAPGPGEAPAIGVELAAAVLLFEVAWADHSITQAETDAVRRALIAVFGLEEATVDALIAESRAEHESSVGIYRFTRAIVKAWAPGQRFELLVQLWRLALCDEEVDKYEEATIRKIAELLYIEHGKFIEAKRTARRLAAAERGAPPRLPGPRPGP